GADVNYVPVSGLARPGDEAQAGGTIQDATHDIPAQAFLQVHRYTRALSQKVAENLWQELRGRSGVGEDSDMPGGVGAVFGEFAFQVIHLTHDQPRMLQKQLAGRGQFHAATVAVEQAVADLGFQTLDAGAGGGG